MKLTNKLIGTLMALGALAIPAQAAVLAVGTQIGIAPGPTVTDTVGNDWNDFAAPSTDNTIHDLDGVAVDGVTVTIAGGGFNDAGENSWVGLGSAPAAFVDSVTTDLWFNGTSMTITGLDTSLTYNLYSVSQGGGAGFDGNDDTHTVTGDVVYGPSTVNRGDARLLGDFHTVLGVSPDGSGQIVLSLDASNPALNGLLIEAVPEPSSTALLGLGGLALILRRRK
jgi:hypothetical protein